MATLRGFHGYYTIVGTNNPDYPSFDKLFRSPAGKNYSVINCSDAMFKEENDTTISTKTLITRPNPRNILPSTDFSLLLIDSNIYPEINDTDNNNYLAQKWTDLFIFIDILRENQLSWSVAGTDPYTCYGDEVIMNEKVSTTQGSWHNAALKYKNHSLIATILEIDTNVSNWEFQYNYYG